MAALYYKSFYFIVFITKSAQNWITWPFLLLSCLPPHFRMLESFPSQHHIILERQLGSAYSSLRTSFVVVQSFFRKRAQCALCSYSVSCRNASFPGHTEGPCPSCAVALRGAASQCVSCRKSGGSQAIYRVILTQKSQRVFFKGKNTENLIIILFWGLGLTLFSLIFS